MWVGVVSLFPEMFNALNFGVCGRAIESNLLTVTQWNPRDYTEDKHRRVDDRPFGGGPGMVMKVQPLRDAIRAAKAIKPQATVIYLSPQGKLLTQPAIQGFTQREALILVNGRYEGIDERLIHTEIDEEWSIGDYVLSGGEFASMVMIDAIARCLPGALGHQESAQQDSFSQNRLDYPVYTRPEEIDGITIPSVLNSGDHELIARWRLKQALGRTWQRRPDLLKRQVLTADEQVLLNEYINESN